MTTTKATKPLTYDHLKSMKKPVTRACWIAFDSEIADEAAEATKKKNSADLRHRARPDDMEALKALNSAIELEEEALKVLRENSVKFVFRGIGRKRYEKLVTSHPPTAQQIKDVKKEDPSADLAWNPDTFVPALISEAIVEPELSIEDVQEMFDSDEWNTAELGSLYMAAFEANSQRRVVDLGNGSRGTQNSN